MKHLPVFVYLLQTYTFDIIYLFIYFHITGVWTQRLHLKSLHQPFFVMGFFKIGCHYLFGPAGFELRSSWSLPHD
jgi:hypothetical protein